MKRITAILCLLCTLSATAQEVAVGIHTENPKGVLHIDGASATATTNPPAGNVTPAQAADDVVIDALGQTGLGTATPAARVDIRAAAPKTALRIADGTQAEGRVLVSDPAGTAWWRMPEGGIWWYAALLDAPRLENSGTASSATSGAAAIRTAVNYARQIFPFTQGSVNSTAGTITVPFAGRYRIAISNHYGTTRSAPYLARTAIQVNGSIAWTSSTWGIAVGWGTLPSYTAILNLAAGDVLSLALDQTEDSGQSFSANALTVFVFAVELLQLIQ